MQSSSYKTLKAAAKSNNHEEIRSLIPEKGNFMSKECLKLTRTCISNNSVESFKIVIGI